jgi:hypothetical protein
MEQPPDNNDEPTRLAILEVDVRRLETDALISIISSCVWFVLMSVTPQTEENDSAYAESR